MASAALGSQQRAPAPVQLEYPEIEAQVPVTARGVTADGQMEIPQDAAEAGWYEYGNAPGDHTGTVVIAAHVGSAQTPVGPLRGLVDAQPGDLITVADAEGLRHEYQVSTVDQLNKESLDLSGYFSRDGAPQLVLITCGGEWNPARNSYDDNVIVTARPTV